MSCTIAVRRGCTHRSSAAAESMCCAIAARTAHASPSTVAMSSSFAATRSRYGGTAGSRSDHTAAIRRSAWSFPAGAFPDRRVDHRWHYEGGSAQFVNAIHWVICNAREDGAHIRLGSDT
ncbi:exported hypothetical protein [Paraburkholderia piptadeniae]|uniref:Uncharacterized protein n=1 Tax=Paraburkholderia piptadeniae TaxID=1701573 RepID=A0A1N7STR5_9BURK|nr:exported hypothetical protein [Paraburkholderia piptadeniae]